MQLAAIGTTLPPLLLQYSGWSNGVEADLPGKATVSRRYLQLKW